MSPKFFVRAPAMTFGLAFVAGQPTSATAHSYPWCAQGDNILHCYYMTREQCEAAVNYRGFCVVNSSAPTPNNEARDSRIAPRTTVSAKAPAALQNLPQSAAPGTKTGFVR
jgi:hypothetical protein